MDNIVEENLIDTPKQDYNTIMESFNNKTKEYNDLTMKNDEKINNYANYLNSISECKDNIKQIQSTISYRDKIRKDLISISKLIKSDKDALEFIYVTRIIAQEYCNFYKLPTVNVPEEIGIYKVVGTIVAEISTVIKYLPSNKTVFEKVKAQVTNKWRDVIEAIDRMQKVLDYIPNQRSTKNVINEKLLDKIKGLGSYIEICQKEINENLTAMMHYANKLDVIKSTINTANKKIEILSKECQTIKDKLDGFEQNALGK